jgi:hypothetical protein
MGQRHRLQSSKVLLKGKGKYMQEDKPQERAVGSGQMAIALCSKSNLLIVRATLQEELG